MSDKLLLPMACAALLMASCTAILLFNQADMGECGIEDNITDNFGSCGIVDNKMWYFTENGTYVEYWGNTSDDNWSAIIVDRDSMQAYVESETERYEMTLEAKE